MRAAAIRLATILLTFAVAGCSDDEPAGGDAGVTPTPGSDLAMTIVNAGFSEGRAFADFRITDLDGTPRDLEGFETRWTLARYVPDPTSGATHFRSLITREATGELGTTQQPAADSEGSYQSLGDGLSRYVFSTPLPADLDLAATYRIAAWTERPLEPAPGVDEEEEIANAVFDFVPAGGAPVPADVVANETCNGCHAPLEAHGGARRDVKLCVTCHNPQLFDPDTAEPLSGPMTSLDFPEMVHRIHRGAGLPSLLAAQEAGVAGIAFRVIGFRGREFVFGETVADGPDGDTLPDLRGVVFPDDVRNCTLCHAAAPLADKWQTAPNIEACTGCHDATWFGEPAGLPELMHPHPGGAPLADGTCQTCHPASGAQFDLSIAGAHTLPRQAEQARGLDFEIVSAVGAAGGSPTVTFEVKNGDGSPLADLATLDILALTLSGPAPAYSKANIVRQDVRETATRNADGTFTYTFAARAPTDAWFPGGPAVPAGAEGTWAVAMEGRRAIALPDGTEVEEGGDNPVAYFAVAGGQPDPRGDIVELAQCDACHGELRAHGNLRREIQYCVMCHTPDNTDWGQRPKGVDGNVDLAATVDGIEERSIRLSRMIHMIHSGLRLEVDDPYAIYGFMGSLHEFQDVRFPGDRSQCTTMCHLPGTFTLDAIDERSPPTLANETGTIVHQGTAAHVAGEMAMPVIQSTACLACHNTPAAFAHAATQTLADGKEACGACHAEGREFAVSRAHRVQD